MVYAGRRVSVDRQKGGKKARLVTIDSGPTKVSKWFPVNMCYILVGRKICSDCKGKGTYKGYGDVEEWCEKCGGEGFL